MNRIGRYVQLTELGGEISRSSNGIVSIVVIIASALVGTFNLYDSAGNAILTKTAGNSGTFTVAGPVYALTYALSSTSDAGNVSVGYLTN
ncbi:MAG: hypothetical protein M0015_05850 [Betaproteobacteria bacterium]|nr:hypothetical protein [Betaproteobacteria bacterium]